MSTATVIKEPFEGGSVTVSGVPSAMIMKGKHGGVQAGIVLELRVD